MSDDKDLPERVAKLEVISNQFNTRISKLENHYSDLSTRVAKLEEDMEWVKKKVDSIDRKLWGVISGIIVSILMMIIRFLI